jgi:RNA polymerase primary sigma factor
MITRNSILDITNIDLKDSEPMTREEEIEAFNRLRSGDDSAMERIVVSNQRFVIREILKFKKLYLPIEDVYQEANCGLLEAIRRFDTSVGVRLVTYARLWIKQSIQQAIMTQTGVVTLPKGAFLETGRMMATHNKLIDAGGLEPTTKDLADNYGRPTIFGKETLASIAAVLSSAPVSINAPTRGRGDDEGGELIDTPLFSVSPDQEDCHAEMDTVRIVSCIKESCRPMEGRIISAIEQYVADGDFPTMRMLGETLGVSRQSVSQHLHNLRGRLCNNDKFMSAFGDYINAGKGQRRYWPEKD